MFLANFHNNDVTLSQFQVMICLLQSFIESLTVVLPYSPVGEFISISDLCSVGLWVVWFEVLALKYELTLYAHRDYGTGGQRGTGSNGSNLCPHVLIAPQLWPSHALNGV